MPAHSAGAVRNAALTIRHGLSFCGQCATPLTADTPASLSTPSTPELYPSHLVEKILTSKTALEGERKQVTVLFADLKGSMELLADRDPEEARATPRPRAGTHDGGRAPL